MKVLSIGIAGYEAGALLNIGILNSLMAASTAGVLWILALSCNKIEVCRQLGYAWSSFWANILRKRMYECWVLLPRIRQ